jgi:hypothetical protein
VTALTPGRRVASIDDLDQAGDYCGPVDEVHQVDGQLVPTGATGVWFLLPTHEGKDMFDRPTSGSGLHHVTSPPWVFRECPDGSVEIRESIACGRGSADGEYWHGYLDEGHAWRQL